MHICPYSSTDLCEGTQKNRGLRCLATALICLQIVAWVHAAPSRSSVQALPSSHSAGPCTGSRSRPAI
eukprot:7992466-Pyramimonas_sp.AAC.1